MRVGIVARPDLDKAVDLAKQVLGLLSDAEVLLEEKLAERLGKKGVPLQAMEADAIISIGGDGTVLLVQQKAPEAPVLGVRMGGTGFLADFSPSEVPEAIKRLLSGELPLRERMRLAVEIGGNRMPDVLNEAVVRTASPGHVMTFEVLINGESAGATQGDGVIIATPTGSTAYSLAAGGPVLDPELEAFVITPICTSKPKLMPMVVPASSVVEVKLVTPTTEALLVLDGQLTIKVQADEKLKFYRSESPGKFFGRSGKFYRKVVEKL